MNIHLAHIIKNSTSRNRLAIFCVVILAGGCTPSTARWSQWGGPDRDFKVSGATVATKWPTDGPAQLWSRQLGEGHSTILAEDGRVYATYRDGDEEVVTALTADTGKTIWEHRYAAPVDDRFETRFGRGPNATPLIDGSRIFSASFTGEIRCLNKDTGEFLWSRKVLNDNLPKSMRFGYSSSPIAYKNTIIVLAGDEKQSILALNQQDGSIVWRRDGFANSYSSPILVNVDGQDQLVGLMAANVVGVDPNNGDLLWRHTHENQWHTNITTPLWGHGNRLFVTSGGEAGSRMLKLKLVDGKTKVEEVWVNRKLGIGLSNVIWSGDTLYCSSGSEGPKFVSAVNAKTGKILWKERGFSRANFVRGDGKLILLDDKGVLAVVSATPKGLTIHAKKDFESPGHSWATPTLVGHTLYLRSGKDLLALDVG